MGHINGVIVAWGRVPSIIVTLGTLAIYRGLLVDLSGAEPSPPTACRPGSIDLPRLNLISIGDFDIRAMVVLALVIVVILLQRPSYT